MRIDGAIWNGSVANGLGAGQLSGGWRARMWSPHAPVGSLQGSERRMRMRPTSTARNNAIAARWIYWIGFAPA